jgi:hypothetical protein
VPAGADLGDLVSGNGEVRLDPLLIHVAQPGALPGPSAASNPITEHPDLSLLMRNESEDGLEQGRLAGPVLAGHDDPLTRLDGEVEGLQHGMGAPLDLYAFELDDRATISHFVIL